MLINYFEMPQKTGPLNWVAAKLLRAGPHELEVEVNGDFYALTSEFDIMQYIVNPKDTGPNGLFLAMCVHGKPPKLYPLPQGNPKDRALTEDVLKPRGGFMSSEEFQERVMNSPKVKEMFLRLEDKQRRFKDEYTIYEQLQQNALEFGKSLKDSPLVPAAPEEQEIPIYKDSPKAAGEGVFLYASQPDTRKKAKPSRKAQASIKKLYS